MQPKRGGQSVNAVVLYCHPVEGSFSSALRDATVRGLQSARYTVSVIDLASDDFNPVMSYAEWRLYMTRGGHIPDDVQTYVDHIRTADVLVFVYPTWWAGLPAQLKGFLDRVLVPHVGFSFDDNGRVRPAIEKLRRIHIVTTYGSPWLYVKVVNDNGRKIISRAIRFATQQRARVSHQALYQMDKATDDDRRTFLKNVEEMAAKL